MALVSVGHCPAELAVHVRSQHSRGNDLADLNGFESPRISTVQPRILPSTTDVNMIFVVDFAFSLSTNEIGFPSVCLSVRPSVV